ncbi:hypothetical protein [Streptomyces spongiicola]|uniref:hypothetical protein n=1 Tax=Streptomyces spongiicola TaxID=1690221 RepID=UPI0013A58BBA|nr:hypothetical protein [Streptomyces spongiicola]
MFTLTGPNHIDANTAVHRLTETRKTDLAALRRRLSDALAAAHTFRDPDLTDEANNRRRADMARAAREQAAADLDRIEAQASQAASLVRTVANKATAPAGGTAEQLLAETRQGRAWDRARALLDAGRTAQDVIEGADLDTLSALRTELPSYLAARHTKPQGLAGAEFTEPDPARVVHTVERALADRLPAEQGAALRARLNLDALEPGLRETLAGLRREVDGTGDAGNALRSAVAARLADRQAAPLPTE